MPRAIVCAVSSLSRVYLRITVTLEIVTGPLISFPEMLFDIISADLKTKTIFDRWFAWFSDSVAHSLFEEGLARFRISHLERY